MVVPVLFLVPFAAAMAAVTAGLIAWSADATHPLRAAVFAFLLAMMAAMLAGAVVYFQDPGAPSLLLALWLSGGLMSVSVFPLFAVFVREARRAAVPRAEPAGWASAPPGFVALIAALVLGNEFLMGWAFSLAAGAALPAAVPLVPFLVSVVLSPWFLFTMAAEMGLTVLLLRHRLPRPVLAIFLTQAAIMLLSPPALGTPGWTAISILGSSALMIGLFVYLFEFLYRNRQFSRSLSTYLVEVLAVYALMMGGLFVWQYFGDGTGFALAVVLEMVVYFVAVLRPDGFARGPAAEPWPLRPHWTFAILSTVFVSELFMGAILSVQLDPATYLGGFPLLALSGPPGTVVLNALSNGFWFIATAAASTWFLVMMGVEMGALVAFKFRETRNLENRIRLLLMMGCYAAFAAFYPSIYFALVFPNAPPPSTVPVLGWSMGIGSYPLAIGVFGVLLVTYVVTGALVVLFGRRVICSVFCTAPLMYQGTAIDAMKSFNRSSRVGRKYLSTRFSGLYSTTLGVVMTALVGTSVLSYLDTTGATNVYIQGNDPSVFLFVASFSVGWYLLFVAIPYVGNYNCVTLGWCYTGTIAQAFHKIGFFKLKVRSKQVCRGCRTLDCAKGCPVGLVDMPGHFRQTGEFRSTKCCGVGDCVEACPYGNLYVSDVRHWVRRRLGLPEAPARPTRLPMVPAATSIGLVAQAPAPAMAATPRD
jgi:polyferredoxin